MSAKEENIDQSTLNLALADLEPKSDKIGDRLDYCINLSSLADICISYDRPFSIDQTVLWKY